MNTCKDTLKQYLLYSATSLIHSPFIQELNRKMQKQNRNKHNRQHIKDIQKGKRGRRAIPITTKQSKLGSQ